MARNTKGQYVGQHDLEIKISKQLQKIADETATRIKPLVRDELERTHRANVYASYQPVTKKGKEVQEYNKTHKHQMTKPYHHTGLLARSIYATIEGNKVVAKVKNEQYPDGASTTKVYDYLKYGTAETSDEKGFYYNNGENFSAYISQPPHNFEARTREDMKIFLNELVKNLQSESWRKANGIDRYINKRL